MSISTTFGSERSKQTFLQLAQNRIKNIVQNLYSERNPTNLFPRGILAGWEIIFRGLATVNLSLLLFKLVSWKLLI